MINGINKHAVGIRQSMQDNPKRALREIGQNKSVIIISLVLTKYHGIGYKRAGATICTLYV